MPTATYVALANFNAAGSETSVTFSNIPNTYRDLVIQGNVIGNSSNGVLNMELNGDTANRNSLRMYANPGTGIDTSSEGLASATIGTNVGTLLVQILDYSATNKHKTTLIQSNDPGVIVSAGVARWSSTSAVTSVKITSNRTFQSGMTLSLYGIVS